MIGSVGTGDLSSREEDIFSPSSPLTYEFLAHIGLTQYAAESKGNEGRQSLRVGTP